MFLAIAPAKPKRGWEVRKCSTDDKKQKSLALQMSGQKKPEKEGEGKIDREGTKPGCTLIQHVGNT